MTKVTTEQKFELLHDSIEHHIHMIERFMNSRMGDYIFDYVDIEVEMLNDYADVLADDAEYCKTQLKYAKNELFMARAEAKEAKRISVLRNRKTD